MKTARNVATDILGSLRSRIGANNLVTSCNGAGCRVYMTDVPRKRVIVDADKAFDAHRIPGQRCDRVLFLLGPAPCRLIAAPIEFKSGTVDASEVAGQLQQGIEFVKRFAPPDAHLACRPILIHGHGLHSYQREILSRTKISFGRQRLTITTARCNHPRNLATALATAALGAVAPAPARRRRPAARR